MNYRHSLVKTSDSYSFLCAEGFFFGGYIPKTKKRFYFIFLIFDRKNNKRRENKPHNALSFNPCGRLMDISPKQVLSGMRSITPNQPTTLLHHAFSDSPPSNSFSTNTQPTLIFQFHPKNNAYTRASHGSGA